MFQPKSDVPSPTATDQPAATAAPPPGVSGGYYGVEQLEEMCIICHDDMLPGSSVTLDCEHAFHTDVSYHDNIEIHSSHYIHNLCHRCLKLALLGLLAKIKVFL